MMPPFRPLTAPPGERALYDALSSSVSTEGWVVLHSLDIANHVRQVEGEADFVAIVPGLGILVIEVKSHRNVDRDANGMWRLGRDAPTPRSPFEQAREAMHSLREYLGKYSGLRPIPMAYAVWFTGTRARDKLNADLEWQPWQVLDSEDLPDVPKAIRRTLSSAVHHLEIKTRVFARDSSGPTDEEAERIAAVIRPRFELATFPADRRRARETQLARFIDEQFGALDAVADNRAVLFTGPAGSGKTLLAMEAARRELAAGQTGRLLCFNGLLGRQLSEDAKDFDGLRVGTFHQELLRLAGLSEPPANAGPDFWHDELPDLALDALLGDDGASAEDFLIVDEVQDIATDKYLDVLDLLVSGGLNTGRLLFFGDFERQAIFENPAGRDLLHERAPHLVSYRLATNCRNVPRIGYGVNLLSGLEPGYRDFRRIDDGIEPTYLKYDDAQEQSERLAAAVRQLRQEGFELHEIVVLSPLRGRAAANVCEDPWLLQVLQPMKAGTPSRGQLRYATIQSFKGLDAPAVIVTDLDDSVVPNFQSVLYIGLTRATDRLIAIFDAGTLRRTLEGK